MKKMTRRQFGSLVGVGATALVTSPSGFGQTKSKVVIIGGGAGGATVARYLAKDSGGAIDVTLIENSTTYTTCYFSNLYVGDVRNFDSITHTYDALAAMDGLSVVHDMATGIDRDAKTVRVAGGANIAYDRLVVAPGIDIIYDSVPGYSESAAQLAPHAWQGGPQTQLLKAKLDALENGDNIIVVAPPNPYRCPPGPYERVSMMAHSLKSRGLHDSTITILDAKSSFSKQGLFTEGWQNYYPGVVEWIPPEIHGGIVNIDSKNGAVETDFDTFEGTLLNIIPAQRAGAIAVTAGLTNDSGFCPIDANSMRSSLDESIFVIGDASIAGAMPKSGFSANSQAKVAAMNIRGDLLSSRVFPARYANTCWSLLSPNNGVKVGAQYEAGDAGDIVATSKFVSQSGEDSSTRSATYQESVGWYNSITIDMFGG